MKVFALRRYAFCLGATCALLAGCGLSQPPMGTTGTMPYAAGANARAISSQRNSALTSGDLRYHADRRRSWMLPEAKNEDLVYVAGVEAVFAFTERGKQVGRIDDFEDPGGLCADRQGDVWATNGGEAIEFAHGSTEPIGEVYAPSPYQFTSCAVDPTTGNLAMTMYQESGDGEIAVYRNASGNPQTYADSDFRYYLYCGYDGNGDLYVNGAGPAGILLSELPGGSSTMITITVDKKIGALGGLQWYGHYLALGDSRYNVVYKVRVADGRGTIEGSSQFSGWTFRESVDFWIYDHVIGFIYSRDYFGFWKYPAGGALTHKFKFEYAATGGTALSVASDNERRSHEE